MKSTPLKSWAGRRGKKMKFVLLRHTLPDGKDHLDLLLEAQSFGDADDKTLIGFKRDDLLENGSSTILWQTHGRRRRLYLTYEGDIGRNRGTVQRVDRGWYIIRKRKEMLILSISGRVLSGQFCLRRMNRGVHLWVRLPSEQ